MPNRTELFRCTTAENLLESLDNQIRVVRQDAAEEAQALKEYKGYRDAEYAVITAELRQNATSGHGRAAGNKKGGSVGDDPFESRVISAGGAFVTKGTPSKGGRKWVCPLIDQPSMVLINGQFDS